MCEHFGYEVVKLERVRIMNIGLKGLPLGEWRDLTDVEMDVIYSLLENSSNDDERQAVKKPNPPKSKTATHSPKTQATKSKNSHSPGFKFGKPPKKNDQKGPTKKPNSRRSKSR
jgi:23S rRNA pseudouridine2604 synthase